MPQKNVNKGVRLMRKTLIFTIAILATLAVFQNAFGATKSRTAVSPYMQTDANSTYTFVGITHPSLNTAATQIGLNLATVGLVGATPSTTFTINAGETYRIFIVSTNHSTVNSNTVTGDRVIFLSTTTASTAAGQIRVTSVDIDPTSTSLLSKLGNSVTGHKYDGLNQLSMWGAIVVPSTSTGFAMEFVGDSHDSAALFSSGNFQSGDNNTNLRIYGRGVN
jgi:hypothetical protein